MSVKLTSSPMKHKPFKTNNLFFDQDIWRILWKSKVHYCVHKSPPSIYNVSHMNPGHTLTSYVFKLHCNVSLLTISTSSNWFLVRLPHVLFVFTNALVYAVCPTHLHWFMPCSHWCSVNLRSVNLPNLQLSPNFSSQTPNLFSSHTDKTVFHSHTKVKGRFLCCIIINFYCCYIWDGKTKFRRKQAFSKFNILIFSWR